MKAKLIISIVILLLFTTFIAQNAQIVQVNFLFWHTEASRALVLMITFALGVITGCLAIWQVKKQRSKKSKDIDLKEEDGHG